ncbi:MAG: FecR domain-containing protein [Burkholderiaceae bacterium]
MDAYLPPRGLHSAGTPAGDDGRPVAESIVEQAVGWYVRLASGQQTPKDQAEFEQWRTAHADHECAWRRLQAIGVGLQASTTHVAPAVSRTVLARTTEIMPARRRAFRALVWTGAGGTALYLAQQQLPWRARLAAAIADERTATGERRSLVLADGSRLMLNTATAVDIRFDDRQRLVVLRSGEIMVATARDAQARPFVVATQDGTLIPVGTRFSVRRDGTGADSATQLAVIEGAVDVRAADAASGVPTRVHAGQQVRFTRQQVLPIEPLRDAVLSWADGTLTAEGMPLGQFIADLDRYRPGWLRCAPEVAHLRITGTWPLVGDDPIERILASLERRLPVRVDRVTRYWVTVSAR